MADDAGDKPSAPPGSERRLHPRLPVEMWVEDLTDGGQVFRRAANLSLGGLYLDQSIPMAVGTAVKLRFNLPDGGAPVTVEGTIVSINTTEQFGMGVKFDAPGPDVQQRLRAYVDRRLTPGGGVTLT
jgi:uncharacterized protein (TIGR02266 family)